VFNIQYATENVAMPNEVELTDEQLERVAGGQDEIEDEIAAWTAYLESEGYTGVLPSPPPPIYASLGDEIANHILNTI
jgi:hypothetical protein